MKRGGRCGAPARLGVRACTRFVGVCGHGASQRPPELVQGVSQCAS